MAALLNKFRKEYSDVVVMNDIIRPPTEQSRQKFEPIVGKWCNSSSEEIYKDKQGSTGNNSRGVSSDDSDLNISDSENIALKYKSNHRMRLRELSLRDSMDATPIAM